MDAKILAIETSCDECSAAIIEKSPQNHHTARILSHCVFSQIDLHTPFGGVVPEIASRNHLEMLNPIIDKTLAAASLRFQDLDAFAVTYRPGLIGALLVGVSAAKALAYSLQKPLIAVDHLEGHLHSLFIEGQRECQNINNIHLPMLVCLVSGGHTTLYLIKQLPPQSLQAEKLAESRDDAAGEAFDKCAKLMGLAYPGGKYIDAFAQTGNPKAYDFPRPLRGRSMDFSFSGLKTAMVHKLTELGFTPHVFGPVNDTTSPQEQMRADLCASIQEAIVDSLLDRITLALTQTQAASLALVGGVSANQRLRQKLIENVKVPLFYPDLTYCTDNAAMIGACAVFQYERKDCLTGPELLKLNAYSNTEM